jgi:hypothetical protein
MLWSSSSVRALRLRRRILVAAHGGEAAGAAAGAPGRW